MFDDIIVKASTLYSCEEAFKLLCIVAYHHEMVVLYLQESYSHDIPMSLVENVNEEVIGLLQTLLHLLFTQRF
jgi:hypothetical protein